MALLGLGSGTFDAPPRGLFLGLAGPPAGALRGAPAVAELTLRPVDPTPPRGVALADAVPGRCFFLAAAAAADALCSSFMRVSSDSEDLIDARLDSLL